MIAQNVIRGKNASEAWAEAFTEVASAKGQRLYHLIVQIEVAYQETKALRHVADRVLESLGKPDEPTILTVRNTIFPKTLVRSVRSAHELPAAFNASREYRQRMHRSNAKGRYFERLIALKRNDGKPFNQLAHTIDKLRDKNASARYEIDLISEVEVSEAMGIYCSERDATKPPRAAFPCLSHLALQRDGELVHCVAYYRSQDMAERAYGNYWAIGQLQQYIAAEAGLRTGSLTVVSGIVNLGMSVKGARPFLERIAESRTV
jgi:thymidylate synthase